MKARQIVIEKILEKLEDLLEDIEELQDINKRHIDRLEGYLSEGLKDKEYSAVVAAKVLDDSTFKNLKSIYQGKEKWNVRLEKIEEELSNIALTIQVGY